MISTYVIYCVNLASINIHTYISYVLAKEYGCSDAKNGCCVASQQPRRPFCFHNNILIILQYVISTRQSPDSCHK